MSESLHRTKEDILQVAANMGLVCIFPEPNELLLDIDEDMEVSKSAQCCLVINNTIVRSSLVTTSKSGNAHVYFWTYKSWSPLEQIAIQACLGSDPVKELLSVLRLKANSDYPTALFETVQEANNVMKWRRSRTYTMHSDTSELIDVSDSDVRKMATGQNK